MALGVEESRGPTFILQAPACVVFVNGCIHKLGGSDVQIFKRGNEFLDGDQIKTHEGTQAGHGGRDHTVYRSKKHPATSTATTV